MKKLLFAALPFLIFSCAEKSSQEKGGAHNNADRKFSLEVLDTVMVDPGEEIIFTQYGLYRADFNEDFTKLYNYNEHENAIEIIDLDKMELERKIKLEKEGPNGTGGYIQNFDRFGNKFLLSEFHKINAFDSTAQRILSLNIQQEQFSGDSLQGEETLKTSGLMDAEGNNFYSLYERDFGEPVGLAIIDVHQKSLRTIPIPGLDALAKFKVLFQTENSKSASYPSQYIQNHRDSLLITSQAINEVYIYDISADSLSHLTFHSEITADRQTDNPKTLVQSQEEMREVSRERRGEVSFSSFYFDQKNKLFYRFSQEKDKEIAADNLKYKYVLTVFDEHFNQLYETADIPLKSYPSSIFVKDGKIHKFINIEDEMAFVVMEVKEI